ncbi:MAG TPA: BON domain-containing protein [Dehalococcoidia bacterium]|jgi:osmotically-inducible protein OsmY|nr:BON domain-containing protein [Dehalococcoidia bacterium]
MTGPDAPRVALLRLRAPVQFRDRWQGTVATVEVDEDWEALNLIVQRGIWRWATSVKLPLSALLSWSEQQVRFDSTSRQAFAREIPPIAAPTRPLSRLTPLSIPAARLDGLLIDVPSRRVTDVIIKRARETDRVPVADVSFDGKTLRVPEHGWELRLYLSDAELAETASEAIRSDHVLTGEERHHLAIDVAAGALSVKGNVRTKQTRDRLAAQARRVPGVATLRFEVVDDIDLELAIGQAIESAGVQRDAEVYARSALGRVSLFGYASTAASAEDIVRAVSRLPGVRGVTSRIDVRTAAPAAR